MINLEFLQRQNQELLSENAKLRAENAEARKVGLQYQQRVHEQFDLIGALMAVRENQEAKFQIPDYAESMAGKTLYGGWGIEPNGTMVVDASLVSPETEETDKQ